MKTKLMMAALMLTVSTAALAMDDAERARQLELYNANSNGGAMVTQETTVDQTGNTTTTTTSTQATNIPADTTDAAAMVQQPTSSTQGLSQRSLPDTAVPAATETAPVAAPLVVNENKMTPVIEGGSTSATLAVQSDGLTQEERAAQLKAYEEYAKNNPAAATPADPNAPYAPPARATANAAAVTLVDGPVTGTAPVALTGASTTTTEKTTETNYTVTSRKVGLVGGRPYPAKKSEVAGGVTMERTVNGVLDTKQVVVPDTVADLKTQKAEGDYFSDQPAAKVYENANTDVKVHDMGMNRLND